MHLKWRTIMSATPQLTRRSFDTPDERRPAGRAEGQIVTVNGITFMRITTQPGWRWTEDVRPIVGGDRCQATHTGIVVSGRLRVAMEDGREEEFGPGDLYVIPPGHEAWTVGDEPAVSVDITGVGVWAKA
jgi:hypothetical protein